MAFHATRSSGCCSVISASHSFTWPAISAFQCRWVSSIWRISCTPFMNFGKSSNCVHWSYAVLTGTSRSMLCSTDPMAVLLGLLLHETPTVGGRSETRYPASQSDVTSGTGCARTVRAAIDRSHAASDGSSVAA